MYQALYRTWRPQRFADVVGQDSIIRTLLNQIRSSRTSHAYLFCGSRGTGKTSTAKIFARALNCLEPEDGEPCGHCAACMDEQSGASLDVLEIDAASNNGVDEIRDLRDKIMFPPSVGKFRVYIIDEVHMLSQGAFNALLKTLEEPPSHAVFILATTEPQKLPATILSRCQRFDFHRIRAEVIQQHLRHVLTMQQISATDAALEQVALAAEGGMRDALSILDMCISFSDGEINDAVVEQVLGTSGRSFLFAFADCLLAEDAAGALELTDKLLREGRDVQVFLRDIIRHMRSLMIAQMVGDKTASLLEITTEDAEKMRAQADKVSPERLMAIMDLLLDAERDARFVSHERVLLEMAVTRICRRSRIENITDLVARFDTLEKKLAAGAFAVPAAAAAKPAARSRPAAPAAKPQPKPPVPAGEGAEVYARVMDRVKREAIDIYAMARRGTFGEVQDDRVIVLFDSANAAYKTIMEGDKNRTRMDAFLSEEFGREMHYHPTTALPQKQEPAPAQDLSEIYDVFGRENVEVVDE